ncbi:hypothetical protein [Methylocella sp. CPCC 101449]|uniref:hypothetical protein n=1 Tax=Methylocella sp. CPCC 101449 TaxID=2987531 RepID=UPI002890099E|nr:hypothetical protein [Methylocella sp. CPCC 101449]MDT2022018.1 hypothetical protein [Methylocella sp. CPCC 101449]HEV2572126.1 hypothetical protein [Beijerinckiaceae bacterium]
MLLGRMLVMFGGMEAMSMRDLRMMRGLFVLAFVMMLRRFAMVLRGEFVMFGSFGVVIVDFFRHGVSPAAAPRTAILAHPVTWV